MGLKDCGSQLWKRFPCREACPNHAATKKLLVENLFYLELYYNINFFNLLKWYTNSQEKPQPSLTALEKAGVVFLPEDAKALEFASGSLGDADSLSNPMLLAFALRLPKASF